MSARYIPSRLSELADVVSNGGVIPAGLLPANSQARTVLRFPDGGTGNVQHGRFWPQPGNLTGTVTLTNGSNVVTGSGTTFTIETCPGMWYFFGADGTNTAYLVRQVVDNTTLFLDQVYTGTTGAGSTATVCCGRGFWWEAWVLKHWDSGYILSDGYGGAHALLWGFAGAMSGNVNGPGGPVSYTGDYAPAEGEWVHWAVRWDGGSIKGYANGIQTAAQPFSGPRIPISSGGGGGVLYIGGSTHSNLPMRLACMRAWDTIDPAGGLLGAFAPERFLRLGAYPDGLPPDFLVDYTNPLGNFIPDLAPVGRATWPTLGKTRHPGSINVAVYGGYQSNNDVPAPTALSVGGQPYLIADPSCPYGQGVGSPLPTETIPAPEPPPAGVKRFDSFGRRNQTWAFQALPDLGSTEAGSLGPAPWQQNQDHGWGILGGNAVPLKWWPLMAWVPGDSPDMDVRVSNPAALIRYLGLAFRVVDQDNYYYVVAFPQATNHAVSAGHCDAGTATNVGSGSTAGAITTLQVVAAGTTATVFVDGATLFSFTTDRFGSAVGAGLYVGWAYYYSTSYVRVKRFELY